MKVLISD